MIPVNEPWLGERETELALEALQSGWISGSGDFIKQFEDQWSSVCHRQHGVAVCTGTAALETAIHALELPKGSEIIMPTFTLIACLVAAVRNDLVPVLVDADPQTWCMDVDQVEGFITPNTSAIMAVHIYGYPTDMDPLLAIAQKHGLKVVEDAAEAHGAVYRDRICGSFGDVSAFSFYGNKIVTTGEGGMVVCDNEDIARKSRSYGNLEFGRQRRFEHEGLGQNYRFSNIQAAIGCAQVEKFEEALKRKHRMGQRYTELLSEIPDLQLPPRSDDCTNVYWVYGVVLGDSYTLGASDLQEKLREAGVGTRSFFLGMHEQPVVREQGLANGGPCPVAERLAQRGFYIPSGLTITDEQIETVVAALKKTLGH